MPQPPPPPPPSTLSTTDWSSSSTIAAVIRSARASLLEPSRPFTPAIEAVGANNNGNSGRSVAVAGGGGGRVATPLPPTHRRSSSFKDSVLPARLPPLARMSTTPISTSPASTPTTTCTPTSTSTTASTTPVVGSNIHPQQAADIERMLASFSADTTSGSRSSTSAALMWCKELNTMLTDEFISHANANSLRERLIKRLFKLVDAKSARLRLRACAVAIKLTSQISPLLETAWVVYQTSKEASNDNIFIEEGLIPLLVLTLQSVLANKISTVSEAMSPAALRPFTAPEALSSLACDIATSRMELALYLLGALRNVTGESAGQKAAGVAWGVEVVPKVLNWLYREGTRSQLPEGKQLQLLIQATGYCRNMSVAVPHARQLTRQGIAGLLTLILSRHATNRELALNVARVLSKLSTDAKCASVMLRDCENNNGTDGGSSVDLLARAALRAMELHAQCAPLVLRLSFTLANLSSTSESTRVDVARHLPIVCSLLVAYRALCCNDDDDDDDDVCEDKRRDSNNSPCTEKEAEEVLISLVRLVAHLAISPELGPRIAASEDIANVLASVLQDSPDIANEELLLNAVSAVTNISFYHTPDNRLLHMRCAVAQHLVNLLLSDNNEMVTEAARALGNYARFQVLASLGAVPRLAEVLQHALAQIGTSQEGEDVGYNVGVVSKALANVLMNAECGPDDMRVVANVLIMVEEESDVWRVRVDEDTLRLLDQIRTHVCGDVVETCS
eukprot:jgi/Chlat1/5755/Chrsp38S05537